MYVHQAKPANAERTPISCSLMGSLREQFRLPSNQRAAVRVSIAHQIFIPKRTPSRGLFLPKRLFLVRYLLGTPEPSRLAQVIYSPDLGICDPPLQLGLVLTPTDWPGVSSSAPGLSYVAPLVTPVSRTWGRRRAGFAADSRRF